MDAHKEVLQNTLDNEKAILEKLRKEYEKALLDVEDVIAQLKGRTDVENAQSIAYQIKYQEALKKQISGILDKLHGEEYTSISEYLSECYNDGFIGVMYELDKSGIPLVFPINQNQVVKAIQLDTKLSVPLYKQIGENVSGLKKVISSSITRGIAASMSYADIARQIRQYMIGDYSHAGGALSKAYTIARTEGHRIQNQAADHARHEARDKGAEIKKKWDATLDGRTRPSHRRVDGEIVELDEKFSNGLLYPGDPDGIAAEVVNCRCVCQQKAAWLLDGSSLKLDNFTKEIRQFDSPEDYAEFKKWYFSRENVDYMKYVYDLEEKYGTKNMQKLLESMSEREYKHFHELESNSPLWHSELRKKYLANGGNVSYNGIEVTKKYSGAISGALNDENDPDYSKRDKHAIRYYEELRNSKKEAFVDSISANSSVGKDTVMKVYQHVFEDKHDLEKGHSYFDPDYDMAESFRRLRTNKDIQPHDIILLRHEALEFDIMQANPKMSYDEAHKMAEKVYDYKKALLEWKKGEFDA